MTGSIDTGGPLCPCGSGDALRNCCRPLLRGESQALTAEALMRSRYTAYVRGDSAYLLRTWHERTRPASLDVGGTAWRGLTVTEARNGGEQDSRGTVTFTALWEAPDGSLQSMTERSAFVRDSGQWFYVDGTVAD